MKTPFVDSELYTSVLKTDTILNTTPEMMDSIKTVTLTKNRSSTVLKDFVNHIVSVYSGKEYKRITVKPEHIGFKLGMFVLTKKIGSSIHNSERNAKKREKLRRKITQKKVRKTTTKAQVKKSPSASKKK